MSFLCRLGRHRPRGIPRWNDGLYFATCERCGRDLVRTAFEGWHVPSGYKVVWSNRPPADRPEVAMIPEQDGIEPASNLAEPVSEPALEPESGPVAAAFPPEAAEIPGDPAPPPLSTEPPERELEPAVEPASVDDDRPAPTFVSSGGSPGGRLPIQDVLAHLNAQEEAERAGEAPRVPAEAPGPQPSPSPAEPLARKRRSTWDFMDDEPFGDDTVPGPQRDRAPGGASPAGVAPPVDRQAEPASRKAGGLPEQWRKARSALHNFFSGPAEPRPVLVTGLALAVAVAVALGLYSAGYPAPGLPSARQADPAVPGGRPEDPGAGGKPDPFAASAPYVSPGQAETTEPQETDPQETEPQETGRQGTASASDSDEVAYVAASLLVCRSAPVPQAPRVRNLLRGKEVRVIGYDGAWASLAYRGGQCWAQAQYLSPVPTL